MHCIGEWKDDHPDGEGEYIWGDIAGIKAQNAHIGPRATHLQVTNRYSGDFEEGVRHGKGTFYYSSGAVYDGEWQDNAKEGQGQYSFENGSVYVGGFANDRMTDKDVWQKQDVASFDLDVDDLLVELSLMKGMSAVLAKSEGVLMEQKQQLAKALLRINSDVLAVYHFYAAYNHNKAQLQMRMYQLWLFFRHAGLISAHVTLAEINRLVHHHSLHPSGTRTASLRNKELSTVHDPNHKLILRDFVECIVRASYFVVENEWTDHAELNLAQRVSLVFGEMMFPKYKQVRAAVTGYTRPIWARKLLVDAVDKHRTPLRAAFIACAANNNAPRIDSGSSTDKEGGVGLTDYTITVRGMLGMLRKRGLLSDTLTITKALELIVTDTGTSVAEVIAASNTELGIPTIDPSVSEPPSSSMLSPSPSLLHSSSASPSKGNRPKLVPSLALSSAMKTPSSPKSSALNTSASNGTNGVFEAAPIQPQDHLDKEIMFDDFLESLCRVVIHMFEAEWKEQKVAEWEAKQEADATAAAAATEAEAGDDIGSAIEDDANGARSSNEHINERHIHDNTNDHHHLNTSVSSHTNPHLQARERGSLRGSLSKGSLRRENTKTRIKTGRNRSGSNTGRLSRQSSRQSSAMFTIDADNSGEWKMERKRQSSNEAAWEKGVAACAERIVAVFLADTAGKKEIVALEVKARALMAREAREREQGQEQGNSEHDQEE